MSAMTTYSRWATEEIRAARADLSRLIEPGDLLGPVMIRALGLQHAHRLVTGGRRASASEEHRVGEVAELAGLTPRQRRLPEALQRWRTRLGQLAAARELNLLHRQGGGLLVPEDDAWPSPLEDLHPHEPLGLWFRGSPTADHPYEDVAVRLPVPGRGLAIVGSREMTDYGGRAAWDLSEELAGHGVTIVSGGAYGVDAAAHRGALASQDPPTGFAPTIAVLAGGVDRFYPAGNERLLRAVLQHGLLLSEMPPGCAPTKHRFLHRNRIIAGLASAVVVVEARVRSGALSTANHALSIGRPVGAVPGSIHAVSSAGCHRLLRDTPAQLVTDAADVMELVAAEAEAQRPARHGTHAAEEPSVGPLEGLSDIDRRICDALPAQRLTTPGKLSEVAGLPMPQVLGGLSRLHRLRLARSVNGHWGRAAP